MKKMIKLQMLIDAGILTVQFRVDPHDFGESDAHGYVARFFESDQTKFRVFKWSSVESFTLEDVVERILRNYEKLK